MHVHQSATLLVSLLSVPMIISMSTLLRVSPKLDAKTEALAVGSDVVVNLDAAVGTHSLSTANLRGKSGSHLEAVPPPPPLLPPVEFAPVSANQSDALRPALAQTNDNSSAPAPLVDDASPASTAVVLEAVQRTSAPARPIKEDGPPLPPVDLDSYLKRPMLRVDSCTASRKNERLGHPDGPLINVIHVPKSAGSSARKLFEDWTKLHQADRIAFTPSNGQELCQRGALNASTLKGIFVGHTGWGLGENADEKRFNMILMREPKSRFFSFINYMRQEKRAPREWMTTPFSQILENYRNERIRDASSLDSENATMSNQLIHHALIDQLSLLATYKCVSHTSDFNPFNCSRPHYVVDEPPGTMSRELCSISNMKRLALENLFKADSIILKDDLESLVTHARFHFDFVPAYARPRRINASRTYLSRQLSIGPREQAWIDEWLKDETEVYKVAEQISRAQSNLARRCVPSAYSNLGAIAQTMPRTTTANAWQGGNRVIYPRSQPIYPVG